MLLHDPVILMTPVIIIATFWLGWMSPFDQVVSTTVTCLDPACIDNTLNAAREVPWLMQIKEIDSETGKVILNERSA